MRICSAYCIMPFFGDQAFVADSRKGLRMFAKRLLLLLAPALLGIGFRPLRSSSGECRNEPGGICKPGSPRPFHDRTPRRGHRAHHDEPQAIEAVKQRQPTPDGTQSVLVDYRDDEVLSYFVLQKEAGWALTIQMAAQATGSSNGSCRTAP
jgi:hypothetical protein